ncbi:sterol reductase [Scenedesmus sp. NREL 46B-D3]|nr:sterol reductase [Scenedesmus sp. NREL 46B-D3]
MGKSDDHMKHQEFEFFGPYVPGLITIVLPLVVLGLSYACNAQGCMQLLPSWIPPPGFPSNQPIYTHDAMLAVTGWFGLVLLLHLLLPGQLASGVQLPNKQRLTYKLNALFVFVVTYGTAAALSFGLGVLDLGWIPRNFIPLTTAAVIFSSTLAAAVYAASFLPKRLLSPHGNSGIFVYDFWMGRELNPRAFRTLDIKEFCELYPGMIGWGLLNLAFAYQQYKQMGMVTNAMVLVNVFQLWYIIDALKNEAAILTTMDITTDGFGFMLAFGDLAWVPFTFCTQARYLADYPHELPLPAVLGILAVKALGFCIFRGANSQKDAFRKDPRQPSVRHLRSLPTRRGTRLIISGWWGMARHINYLGDWIMGLAWCMPCGLGGLAAVVPYFYCIYFASLLLHRERRDEAACRAKYGADWDRYCAMVPWRIIPYVY